MKLNGKAILDLFKQTAKEWSEDKAPRLGAALAYYTVFSIAPLLVIAIAIVGVFFGEEAARGQIQEQLGQLIGGKGAEAMETMVESANQKRGQGIFASIISFVMLLFGASGVVVQLKDALNTVWEVPEQKIEGGIKGFIKTRLLSFGLVLGVGFLLLVSLVLSAILAGVGKFASGLVPMAWLMQILNIVVSFGVITVLFAMIFKYLPDIKLRWKDVWLGAAVTALMFVIGKYLLGLYLGKSSAASAYGAAGSIIVLLIWVYYSAQILFFGAELTQVYTRNYGSLKDLAAAEPSSDKAEDKSKVSGTAAASTSGSSKASPDEKKKAAASDSTKSDKQKSEKDNRPSHPGRPASAHVPAFATKASPVANAAAKGLSYFIVGMLGLNTAKRATGILPDDSDRL